MIVYEENNLQMNYNNKNLSGCKANVYKCIHMCVDAIFVDNYLENLFHKWYLQWHRNTVT